jgi:hypothetical protein
VRFREVLQMPESENLQKIFMIDDPVSVSRPLNFIVSAKGPSNWMLHNSRPNHVKIDINETASQMITCFYSCRVVPIFPESSFSLFSQIKFLGGSTGNQLDRFRERVAAAVVPDK